MSLRSPVGYGSLVSDALAVGSQDLSDPPWHAAGEGVAHCRGHLAPDLISVHDDIVPGGHVPLPTPPLDNPEKIFDWIEIWRVTTPGLQDHQPHLVHEVLGVLSLVVGCIVLQDVGGLMSDHRRDSLLIKGFNKPGIKLQILIISDSENSSGNCLLEYLYQDSPESVHGLVPVQPPERSCTLGREHRKGRHLLGICHFLCCVLDMVAVLVSRPADKYPLTNHPPRVEVGFIKKHDSSPLFHCPSPKIRSQY